MRKKNAINIKLLFQVSLRVHLLHLSLLPRLQEDVVRARSVQGALLRVDRSGTGARFGSLSQTVELAVLLYYYIVYNILYTYKLTSEAEA